MADPDTRAAAQATAANAAKLTRTARAVEHSAGAVQASAGELTDSADRSTQLAADRTVLAAERTYAAWIRTGLSALASGVGARALLTHLMPEWLIGLTGSVLIGFSSACFVAAVWRELWPGAAPPRPNTPRLPAALVITLSGFLVLVSAAALVGIWVAGR